MWEIIIGIIILIALLCAVAWYRIVGPSEAHVVVTPFKKFVVSSDEAVSTTGHKTYFAIPQWIPFFGRAIRKMDVTIKELVLTQETYEKGQARYKVQSSMKFRISDVLSAAETFISLDDLFEQLKEVVRASVRAVTVKYDVIDARAMKQKMAQEIENEMKDDLAKWGITLTNFQLVDFQDTSDSHIISDISKRREKEIEATTREQNAEKERAARMKEAEAEEKAREREIEKDRVIGEREQTKAQKIAEQQKLAEEKRFEVIKVQTIKQANIDKEKAIVEAEQSKEQELILKEKKRLEGEGDRLREEERAKGLAAPIREKGLAEAEAKDALQDALNKFGDSAIRALVAEKVVAKDEAIGVATAKALEKADMKVFSGGDSDAQGFNLAKIVESARVGDNASADAIVHRLGLPNDLGFSALGLQKASELSSKKNFSNKKPVKKD